MQIPLIVSELMNNESKKEFHAIRMPEDFRVLYGFTLHDFITLKSTTGNFVTFQICKAHKVDAESDSLSAYVNQDVFSELKVKDSTEAIQEVELVEGITLGCDPEFFIIDPQGHIVNAGLFFRKMADVGYDGSMVEIRPEPSINEVGLASNIMRLIDKARVTLDSFRVIKSHGINYSSTQLRMVAASAYQGVSAGFHLHYGLPTPLLGKYPYNKKLLAAQIIKAMDFYVGIPGMIPEGHTDNFRRIFPSSPYGRPGPYGSGFRLDHKTLEYRVPGGFLLRHPLLTKGLVSLGAVVVEDAVSRIREATDTFTNINAMTPNETLSLLYPNIPHVNETYQSIVAPTTEGAIKNLNVIMNDVRKMVGYTKRSIFIETFFKYLTNNDEFSNDIEVNWRAYYARQQGQMDVLPAPH